MLKGKTDINKIIVFFLLIFSASIIYSQNIAISKIIIDGNKRTKESIILRELTFVVNKEYTREELKAEFEKSKENLINTSLFNFVFIEISDSAQSMNLTIKISVEERWYLWPYPILEHADRNINSWLQGDYMDRINYGISVTQYNFRGRREYLKAKLRYGYKQQFALAYGNPGVDKNKRFGFETEIAYFRQHEIAYSAINNELVYFRDDNSFVKEILDYDLLLKYRRNHYNQFLLFMGFNRTQTADTVSVLNANYLLNGSTDQTYLKTSAAFLHDKRDYVFYPLKGHYFRLTADYKYFTDEKYNLAFILADFKNYLPLSKKFFHSAGLIAKKSLNKKQPYFIQEALGYGYYLRGYEYYVVDGNDFIMMQNNFKFEILPKKIKDFKFIPFSKFSKVHYAIYANAFFDCGYVQDKYAGSQGMLDEFLYSYGLGLDFVTYYDRVMRIDFSVNKKGEKGVFLHFAMPI
ncbi:MAG: hypothetical protein A2W91_08775 [Bacteroidetes bacterium GWF2_38_335]|nr:MAG: hypothetical protein A2W91_08775 [Bacteroidetes bacterium GWF2_38_335]OFY80468.1 MAG: hypothetical protein A2281_08500 [Bacteroidetes bacterium RIFOXYA12_FULL_38_20]HBS85926.1 hypothetical protein [Bacteroidales bacterium]